MIMKCVYFPINVTKSVAGSTTNWHFFAGNNLFDPDYTGIGTEATNQINAMGASLWYNKYAVLGCKASLKVWTHTDTGVTSIPIAFGPVYDDDTNGTTPPTMPSNVNANYGLSFWQQFPNMRTKIMWAGTGGDQNTGRNFVTFSKKYFSTRKIIGNKFTPDDNWGTIGSSGPPYCWFWAIGFQNLFGAQVDFNFNIKLVYYVEFFDRKPQTQTQL